MYTFNSQGSLRNVLAGFSAVLLARKSQLGLGVCKALPGVLCQDTLQSHCFSPFWNRNLIDNEGRSKTIHTIY